MTANEQHAPLRSGHFAVDVELELALSNDLGLLSEEYDARERCMLGNFPQALTHMALINSARLLSISPEQAKRASEQGERPAAAIAAA